MKDFSKFDKMVDCEALAQDVKTVEANGGVGDYKEVPLGTYEVKIAKMELTESKKGDPMVSIWFKIIAGDYENSMLFFNQVILKDFQIHIVNELLRAMDKDIEVHFESYTQYANLLMDIAEDIDEKYEYCLEYGERKTFKTFKITDVFVLD